MSTGLPIADSGGSNELKARTGDITCPCNRTSGSDGLTIFPLDVDGLGSPRTPPTTHAIKSQLDDA